MKLQYNIENSKDVKRLDCSKRFLKYPNMFLSEICDVRVNGDDFLNSDEFIIHSRKKALPRKIYLYGKKGRENNSDNLYLNYWMKIFLKTVEKGNLYKYDFEKSDSKIELCIGLPLVFRYEAYNYNSWKRENIIEFLSCLFDTYLEESEYEQQDLFEELAA